jgi:hypothetical protein
MFSQIWGLTAVKIRLQSSGMWHCVACEGRYLSILDNCILNIYLVTIMNLYVFASSKVKIIVLNVP